MIVVDASVVVEMVLQTERGRRLSERLLVGEKRALHAPHLIGVEAAQALRRLGREGRVRASRVDQAMSDLFAFGLERHGHEMLLPRAWELRESLTIYDGVYLALAELLEAPLLTCDGRLARAPGVGAVVEVA